MSTLYRKYRPQNFSEIVGQNHIKLTLENEITNGKVAHAYLFCGPRAVGKTSISRIFSKAINCLDRKKDEFEPCNKCDVCNETNMGRNLDIIEIDAASHTGVDNVRDNIISVSRLAPSHSKYKVFIIDEVHMLSVSAFNALLKTLEEPPANTIFILCTTEVHKIPATIISRCQRFDFRRISVKDIVQRLEHIASKENIKVEKSILEAIARQSEGHLRDAESLFGQVISIGGKEITQKEADLVIPRSDLSEVISLIGFLANKDAGGGIGLINKLITEGVELKRFTDDLIELLRKLMLSKVSPVLSEKLGLELGENLDIEINKISQKMELAKIVIMLERFIRARNEVKSTFITQLPLEIAIAELCFDINNSIQTAPTRPVRPTATPVSAPIKSKLASAPVATPAPASPTSPPVSQNKQTLPPQVKQSIAENINKTEEKAEHKFVQPDSSKALISKELLQEKWSEVLIRVKKYNHSLPFILQVCDPRDVNGNQVCMAFKYKFHKERLADVKMREVMEKVLFEVFEQPLTIEAIIDEMMESKHTTSTPDDITLEPEETPAGEIAQEETSIPVEEVDKVTEIPQTGISTEPPVVGEKGKGMMDDLLKTFGGKVVG